MEKRTKSNARKNNKNTRSDGAISAFVQQTGRTISKTAQRIGEVGKNAVEVIQDSMTIGGTEFKSLDALLQEELKDLYSAEYQLTEALPKMAEKASNRSLKAAFNSHLVETKQQIKRLESIATEMKCSLKGKTCKAMKGLIEEGNEVLKAKGNGALIDTALIAAAQRVEHYEMAGYGCVRAMAEKLGLKNVARTLQQTLDEEGAADKKLTKIALGEVLSGKDVAPARSTGSRILKGKSTIRSKNKA